MNSRKLVDNLNLDDHRLFDKDVQAVAAIQFHISIYHRQRFLTLYFQSVLSKLKGQASLIRRLQQPRPKRLVHLNSTTDDTLCNMVQPFFSNHSSAISALSAVNAP